jgi:hypothetical protein
LPNLLIPIGKQNTMGCGPSNGAEVHTGRAIEAIAAPVAGAPLVLALPYKHGSAITQVKIISF